MTLFVGGPRHGQQYEQPTETLLVAGSQAAPVTAELPPLHVDVASGTHYVRTAVTVVLPDVKTGTHIEWTGITYVHESLANAPVAQGAAAFSDAVVRWWFIQNGKSSSTGAANGRPDIVDVPVVFHVSTCTECDVRKVFATMRERAMWMRTHADTEGHPASYEDIVIEEGTG